MKNLKYILLLSLLALPLQLNAGDVSALSSLKSFTADVPAASVPAVSAPVAAEPSKAASETASLSGEALFNYLSASNQMNGDTRGITYSSAKTYMYAKVDNVGCEGHPGIITFYSQVCAAGSGGDGNSYHEQGDQNRDGVVDKIVNVEHLWPQSFFGKALPMVADLHHLQSTFSTPNGRRSNYKFCETKTASYSTSSGSKLSGGRDCFEPADAVKGDVARSILYFVTIYHDKSIRQGGVNYKEFWTDNIDMFLRWNRNDPPDAAEKHRNDLIEQFQHNRNPYVDDYQLADRVGAATFAKY